jgi:hypothetical protein
MNVLQKSLSLLSKRERRQFWVMASPKVLGAFLGLAALLGMVPFLYSIVNPNNISSQPLSKVVYEYLSFENQEQFLLFSRTVVSRRSRQADRSAYRCSRTGRENFSSPRSSVS